MWDVAREIADHEGTWPVLIEVDCGGRRTGVGSSDTDLLAIAETLGDQAAGVLTHAGHSYGCRSPQDIASVAEQERVAAVQAAERLRGAGWPAPMVSVGSTPTAVFASHLTGVSELRPGVYLFGDLFQAAIGACALDDIAVSVLATVVSRRGERMVLDAGGPGVV